MTRFWREALGAFFPGLGWVGVVLLAVLALLLVDTLLVVPGLISAYYLMGIPWHWKIWVPDPIHSPGPDHALLLGFLATLIPAAVDALVLYWTLERRRPR